MKGLIVGALLALGLAGGGYFLFFNKNLAADPMALRVALEARVDRFWKLRIKNDWATIYQEIMEPKIKEHESLQDFVQARGVIQYLSYEILRAEIDGATAKVTSAIEVKINHPITAKMKNPYMESTVEDQWLLVDGTWYRKYENKGFGE